MEPIAGNLSALLFFLKLITGISILFSWTIMAAPNGGQVPNDNKNWSQEEQTCGKRVPGGRNFRVQVPMTCLNPMVSLERHPQFVTIFVPDSQDYHPVQVSHYSFTGTMVHPAQPEKPEWTERVILTSSRGFNFFPPATTQQLARITDANVLQALNQNLHPSRRIMFLTGPSTGEDVVIQRVPRTHLDNAQHPEVTSQAAISQRLKRGTCVPQFQTLSRIGHISYDKMWKDLGHGRGEWGYWFDNITFPRRTQYLGPIVDSVTGAKYDIKTEKEFQVIQSPTRLWVPYTQNYQQILVRPTESSVMIGDQKVEIASLDYSFWPPAMPSQNIPPSLRDTSNPNLVPLKNRVTRLDHPPPRSTPPHVNLRPAQPPLTGWIDTVHFPIVKTVLPKGSGEVKGEYRTWKEQKVIATFNPIKIEVPKTDLAKPIVVSLPQKIRYKMVKLEPKVWYTPAKEALEKFADVWTDTPPDWMASNWKIIYYPRLRPGQTGGMTGVHGVTDEVWNDGNHNRAVLVDSTFKIQGHQSFRQRPPIGPQPKKKRKKANLVPGVSDYLRYAVTKRHMDAARPELESAEKIKRHSQELLEQQEMRSKTDHDYESDDGGGGRLLASGGIEWGSLETIPGSTEPIRDAKLEYQEPKSPGQLCRSPPQESLKSSSSESRPNISKVTSSSSISSTLTAPLPSFPLGKASSEPLRSGPITSGLPSSPVSPDHRTGQKFDSTNVTNYSEFFIIRVSTEHSSSEVIHFIHPDCPAALISAGQSVT